MGNRLKPCPFCGSTELVIVEIGVWVECKGCKTLGPDGNSEQEALEKWNKLHALTNLIEWLEGEIANAELWHKLGIKEALSTMFAYTKVYAKLLELK